MGAPRLAQLIALGALYLLLSPPAAAQTNQRLSAFKSATALSNYFRDIVRARLTYIEEQEKKRCDNEELIIKRKRSGLPSTIVTGLVRDSRGKTPVHGARIWGARDLTANTGPNGRFRLVIPIQDPKQPAQVIFRAIGYDSRSFQVKAGDSVEVLAPLCATAFHLEETVVTAGGNPSVTNTQHAGVDEGGIVKLHGNHLVILRRGRLFTVAVGDSALRPVAAVDAFDPGLEPQYTYYDEMLIYRDKVVVVGYSYHRGTTELGIFRIDAQGGLLYLTTYQLRSHDYYSARNYASRLIGSRLVFYTPFYLGLDLKDPFGALPAMRRWGIEKDKGRFERLVTPQTVFRTDWQPSPREWVVVHTVTVCNLDGDPLPCTASAVIGGADRSFYVSPSGVYVWAGQGGEADDMPNASLLRFGIHRLHRPGAMAVQGSPIDQFSFLEEMTRVRRFIQPWEPELRPELHFHREDAVILTGLVSNDGNRAEPAEPLEERITALWNDQWLGSESRYELTLRARDLARGLERAAQRIAELNYHTPSTADVMEAGPPPPMIEHIAQLESDGFKPGLGEDAVAARNHAWVRFRRLGRSAVVHGDVHLRNMLVRGQSEIHLIDFAGCGPGHPAVDLVRFEMALYTGAVRQFESEADCVSFQHALSVDRMSIQMLEQRFPDFFQCHVNRACAYGMVAAVRRAIEVLQSYGGDPIDYLAAKYLIAWQHVGIIGMHTGLARAVIEALRGELLRS